VEIRNSFFRTNATILVKEKDVKAGEGDRLSNLPKPYVFNSKVVAYSFATIDELGWVW
jgi:hypothetical protein